MMDYAFGTPVKFKVLKRDIHHGVAGDEVIEWTGYVNGEAFEHSGNRYVPLDCDRVGKGATTIVVSERNILSELTP